MKSRGIVMIYDLIIIGMGPAGMSAGIYAKRSGLKALVLEATMPGGVVNITSEVDNYLGFYDISGPELANKFFEHVNHLEIDYKIMAVKDIKIENDIKHVITEKEIFLCKKIIIATGRKPRELGLPNEKELLGKGISRCALCDAPLFKNKKVAVVGGGSTALEEALYLANVCEKVYLIHRRDEFRGENVLQERVLANKNIEILYSSWVTAINSENDKLKSITLTDNSELEISGLFIYIGYVPGLDFISLDFEKNPAGYLLVNENYETNIPGIYAVGDIIFQKYYQIVTAVAQGAVAALNANAMINREQNGNK